MMPIQGGLADLSSEQSGLGGALDVIIHFWNTSAQDSLISVMCVGRKMEHKALCPMGCLSFEEEKQERLPSICKKDSLASFPISEFQETSKIYRQIRFHLNTFVYI